MISTSLNSATAVTDEHGRFHLRTDRSVPGDEYFTITVLSGEKVFQERIMNPPARGSDFVLMAPDRVQFVHPPYNR